MSLELKVFDTFTKSLGEFETQDKALYKWERNRIALTHALATRLWQQFSLQNKNINVDMAPVFSRSHKSLNPDILVHNRETAKRQLALVCRNDYLSDEEQSQLLSLSKRGKCTLVMALAFFPQKNYMLVYRATEEGLQYFHFDRNTLTMNAVRNKKAAGNSKRDRKDTQLKLGIR